jgi:dTDP-4-amino-4,6-dideoxygalactose transaminase
MRDLKTPYEVTRKFEEALCDYTGAPYAVAVDNCSNAIFLALKYYISSYRLEKLEVHVPSRTYPSVPAEIIHAGGRVVFDEHREANGAYLLLNTPVVDSALRFTADMYQADLFFCLSFTGPYKHLKLGKGGAILTDNKEAYEWFKKARFSGRSECSYHDDNFDDNPVIGWNFYMLPEIAARGLMLMGQFYNPDGSKKHNEDLELPYPDLSKFQLWK